MRNLIVLTSTVALAACGGGMGAQSAGSTSVTGSASPTPSPTQAPASTFVIPTATKTYTGQSAVQMYKYDFQEIYHYDKVLSGYDISGRPIYTVDVNSRTLLGAGQNHELYTANASTVRSPGVTVSYDPRNAQFTLQISQNGLTDNMTFQDPAHRTDFSGATTPQNGVPNLETGNVAEWRLKGVQYLQADSGSVGGNYDVSTFFYDLPNDQTHQYVTWGGFVRNAYNKPVEETTDDRPLERFTMTTRATRYERAAFVFGEATPNSAVPTTGSATYTGGMIASMVNNPNFDVNPNASTWFQWLQGTASVAINFASGGVTTNLTGTTLAPLFDNGTSAYPAGTLIRPGNASGVNFPTDGYIPTGATFTATGSGTIDLVNKGGFTGTFSSAQFSGAGLASPAKVDIVGSSLDGAFYGPAAQEVGASFRIVGGIPDQRVDIIGAFTGKK
jgi:hypothetical protein